MTLQPNPRDAQVAEPGGTLRINGVDVRADGRTQATYLNQAFFWMFAGLLMTAGIAAIVQANTGLLQLAARNILPLVLGQLVLVMVISWGITRISATVALGLFFVYAASLGLVVGLIVSQYAPSSVAAAFISASAMFGGAALYGYTTKRSLVGIGGMVRMGIFGLFAAIVVNIFIGGSTFAWIISLVGVVLFTVLTAFHVQRIAKGELVIATGSVEKAAVIGALALYLDFVNVFLFLLRLFGGRR